MTTLSAGFARECITPPAGAQLIGYASRTQPSLGVHDDLFASAVALSADGEDALLLALDVGWFDLSDVAALKAAVHAETGVAPEAILINTSHTHAGPRVATFVGVPPDAAYMAELTERCVRAAAAALADGRPATLQVGAAAVDIGTNRRELTADGRIILGVNPKGQTLPEVTVWRLSRDGALDVALFSIPMHGTTLGGENLFISAEWMGAAVRHLEGAHPDLRGVFLTGCGADQNPYREEQSFEQVDRLGREAARAVGEALAGARPVVAAPLRSAAWPMELPLAGGGADVCPIHGLRLGDAVLVGLGGEAFVEYAFYTRRRSAAASTMALAYTDGSVGYLPVEAAYAEGGYETEANLYFPMGESWAPEVEGAIKADIDAMLQRLDIARPTL
jgi:hypothetical protein